MLFTMMSCLAPAALLAVNDEAMAKELRKASEGKRMDRLSLIAYISTVAGIGSLFFIPGASLLLMPVGLVLGLVAILGRKNRYERRRGRGLALAAIALGGAYTLALVASFAVFVLFGF